MILLSDLVTASTTDLLTGTRLSSIPYDGSLVLQFIADLNTAAAGYDLTVQLPNGDVPIDVQRVPADAGGVVGVMDDRQLLQATFRAPQGGHFTIALTETGTAVCFYRIALTP